MYFKNRKKYLVPFFLLVVLLVLPYLDPWLLNSQEAEVMAWTGFGRMLPEIVFILADCGMLVSWLLLYFGFRFAVLTVLVVHIFSAVIWLMSGLVVITSIESFLGGLYYVSLGVLLTDAFKDDQRSYTVDANDISTCHLDKKAVERLKQVTLIKKCYNYRTLVLFLVSAIGLLAFLTLDTTADDLLFKSLFLIAFAPISIALIVGNIFSIRKYPSQIIFDFEKENILIGKAVTVNFDEIEVGLVHSKFGFLGIKLVLTSGQNYIYQNFFKSDIDESYLESTLRNIPSIKYLYENRV